MKAPKSQVVKLPKFSKLNFNLKNEIFKFLPIYQTITTLTDISKRFLIAIEGNKLFKEIKKNFKKILEKISFYNRKNKTTEKKIF